MTFFTNLTDCSHRPDRPVDLTSKIKFNNMFGKLNTGEIDKLISRQLVGRIGCHADGITYVVPVSYAYDGTYIYAYAFKGMKIDMMRKNPKVCFQADNTKNLANWQSVICWGEFEELTKE